MSAGDRSCSICGAANAKYKCPADSALYCSVTCSKKHRKSHVSDESVAASTPVTVDTKVTVAAPTSVLPTNPSKPPLAAFAESDELQVLFKEHPTLKNDLLGIYEACSNAEPEHYRGAGAGNSRSGGDRVATMKLHQLQQSGGQGAAGFQAFVELVQKLESNVST